MLNMVNVCLDPQQVSSFTSALQPSSCPLLALSLEDTGTTSPLFGESFSHYVGIENYENMSALTVGFIDTHVESLSIIV